jgi:hypothetical protein
MQRKPFRPALVPDPVDSAAARRGDVLRMLAIPERIPPLLPFQRERVRFDMLPPYPRNVVLAYQDDDKDTDVRTQIGRAVELLVKLADAFPAEYPPIPNDQAGRNKYLKEIANRQMKLAQLYADLERELEELKSLADDAKKEPAQWQVNYDYVQAMLLYRMAHFYEYQAMLGKVRKDELPQRDPKLHPNGYRMVPKAKGKLSDREADARAMEATKLLQQIAEKHKGTPWQLVAKRELLTNLGLEWQPW